METAEAKLVVIVLPYDESDRLARELKQLGVTGYTTMGVDGFGSQGTRRYGLTDGANVRVEIIVTASLRDRIFEHLTAEYADVAFVAYTHDVSAIPRRHFE